VKGAPRSDVNTNGDLGSSAPMSAIPPKADIRQRDLDVRFVPKAEVAVIRSVELIVHPGAKDPVGEMGVRGDLAPTRQGWCT
jgi:hypothetical protein